MGVSQCSRNVDVGKASLGARYMEEQALSRVEEERRARGSQRDMAMFV